jgi:hypothetical protein
VKIHVHVPTSVLCLVCSIKMNAKAASTEAAIEVARTDTVARSIRRTESELGTPSSVELERIKVCLMHESVFCVLGV